MVGIRVGRFKDIGTRSKRDARQRNGSIEGHIHRVFCLRRSADGGAGRRAQGDERQRQDEWFAGKHGLHSLNQRRLDCPLFSLRKRKERPKLTIGLKGLLVVHTAPPRNNTIQQMSLFLRSWWQKPARLTRNAQTHP